MRICVGGALEKCLFVLHFSFYLRFPDRPPKTMAPAKKTETGNTAEASSGPVSSENKTPKSLKPKPKISRKSLNNSLTKANKLKGALQVEGGKSERKEMSVLGSKNVSINNEKEDAKNLNTKEMKPESAISGEHDEKNQANINIKKKLARLRKKQRNGKNKDKLGGLENEQGQMNKEKHGRFQKKQHNEKKKGNRSGLEKKERGQLNKEKHVQLESHQNEKKTQKIGGLIFMCNAKTKPDCFRYRVMGVPMSKKDLVLGVKPGIKLFLYDFDLKLMYGVYRASSSGGMKLEPAAFNGAFPVQVRFNIHQDCYPLPESVFRKAIKENYNEKQKFDTELTVQQVKKLIQLFRPAELQSHAPPPMWSPPMVTIHEREVNEGSRESWRLQHRDSLARDPHTYDEDRRYPVLSNENDQHYPYRDVPLPEREDFSHGYFPSETEYRTYGLRRERQNFTPTTSHAAPALDSNPEGPVRERLLMHPSTIYGAAAAAQGQATRHDPLSVTEKEYQSYGLFPRQELHFSSPLATTTVASTVDSYSKVPYYTYHYGGSFLDPDRLPSTREEVPLGSSFRGMGETYPSETDLIRSREYLTQTGHSVRGEYYSTETNHLGRRANADGGMLYSTYDSNALSEYNQIYNSRGSGPESSLAPVSAPVSSRYSFAGPSLSHR